MSFSWNKWRQYIIEEASVNEEIHEGVWGYGSPQKMKMYIDKLKDIFVMDDVQEINKEITRINSALFNIFGSDDFHDTYDRAKANLKKGDLDRFKNDLSDLIVKAREIHADQLKGFTDINEEDPQAVFNRGPNDFGNDDESRYQFIAYRLSAYENHPQYKELQGHVRTMADEMDIEERSLKFDDAFAKALKIMDLEHMAMNEESLVNPEAEEIDAEDLDAAADYFDSLEEERKPGFSNKVIIDSFMEDFDKATRSTGDIQYAQEEVIKAYKTTFKNFPGVSDAIDAAVADFDRKARRDVFQNVADDPEVGGMDMMGEGYEDNQEPTNEIFGFGSPVDWREMNFGNDPSYAPGLETFKKSPIYKELNKAVKIAKKSGKSEGFDVPKDLVGAVTTIFWPMRYNPEDGPLHSVTIYVAQEEANDAKDMGKDFKEFFRVLGVLTTGAPFKQFEPSRPGAGRGIAPFAADFDFKIPRNLRGQYKDAIAKYYEKEGIDPKKIRENAELEGEVQTEIDAIDEAINEMALDRAMEIANKLDAMQNDLEATLSQDEIDTLSDAIVLLRQK